MKVLMIMLIIIKKKYYNLSKVYYMKAKSSDSEPQDFQSSQWTKTVQKYWTELDVAAAELGC